jgi:fatty acid desaturase
MVVVRRYGLLALSLVVVGVLAVFLGFFLVFVLAPLVPLALFYLVYLAARERGKRRAHRLERRLLDHEAAERRRLLDRDDDAREQVQRLRERPSQ